MGVAFTSATTPPMVRYSPVETPGTVGLVEAWDVAGLVVGPPAPPTPPTLSGRMETSPRNPGAVTFWRTVGLSDVASRAPPMPCGGGGPRGGPSGVWGRGAGGGGAGGGGGGGALLVRGPRAAPKNPAPRGGG